MFSKTKIFITIELKCDEVVAKSHSQRCFQALTKMAKILPFLNTKGSIISMNVRSTLSFWTNFPNF